MTSPPHPQLSGTNLSDEPLTTFPGSLISPLLEDGKMKDPGNEVNKPLTSRYSQCTGSPSWRYEELLLLFLRTFSAWNVTYLPPTSTITHRLSLIARNRRDSRLAAYAGVVFVWEPNGFAGKVNSAYILWIKSTYPVHVAVLYFLLFACSSGRSNAISASYRSVGLWAWTACGKS